MALVTFMDVQNALAEGIVDTLTDENVVVINKLIENAEGLVGSYIDIDAYPEQAKSAVIEYVKYQLYTRKGYTELARVALNNFWQIINSVRGTGVEVSGGYAVDTNEQVFDSEELEKW